MNEPPPPPSRARSGVTANQTEGRGCEEGPQPIAVEGAGPGSRRAAAAGSPRAESGQRLRGAADKSCMEDPAAPGAGSPPANGNGVGHGSGKGKPVAPKGREAFRSQRRESEVRARRASVGAGRLPVREAAAEVLRPRPPPLRAPPLPLPGGPCRVLRRLDSGLCSPDPSPPASYAGLGLSSPLASPLGARRHSAISSVPDTFKYLPT